MPSTRAERMVDSSWANCHANTMAQSPKSCSQSVFRSNGTASGSIRTEKRARAMPIAQGTFSSADYSRTECALGARRYRVARGRLGNAVRAVKAHDLGLVGHVALAVRTVGGHDAVIGVARQSIANSLGRDRLPGRAQLGDALTQHAHGIELGGGEGVRLAVVGGAIGVEEGAHRPRRR